MVHVAKRPDEQPRKRFTRSGHTSFPPRVPPPTAPLQPPPTQAYGPPPTQAHRHPQRDSYSQPTYHHVANASQPYGDGTRPSVARAALSGTARASRLVTRKVISASKADGAH